MDKKRVFLSFDYDNDNELKNLMIGQARLPDSPFELINFSLKEAAPEWQWEAKAKRAINMSDLVIVIVGRSTYRASGVLKEVRMTRGMNKPIVQMIGRAGESHPAVPDAGRLYAWSWENLKNLLGG